MRSVVLCLLWLCVVPAHAELKIAVTDNFYGVAKAIAAQYQQTYGKAVRLTPGPAQELYEQIQAQAGFDVFLSHDVNLPRQLIADGLGDADSFMVYASGELMLWCPRQRGAPGLDQLESAGTIAVANPLISQGNPFHGRFGKATEDFLVSRGLWEPLKPRLLVQGSPAEVISALRAGTASCGFVAHDQWLQLPAEERGNAWRTPSRRDTLLKQGAIVMKRSPRRWDGRDFLVFMRTAEMHQLITSQGYRVTGAPVPPPPLEEQDD